MSTRAVLPAGPVWTARAPGRLDVMGGIADYSGATVLQLPLAEAVTVSLQRTAGAAPDIATRRGRQWQRWSGRRDDAWGLYVTGVLDWCRRRAHETGLDAGGAVRVRITSEVPEGMGVASSAALELATMAAACAAYGVALPLEAMARACQWVENTVVGAPCGIMDQMTSACGRQDALLRLACRPATIEGYVPVPEGWRCFGITTGQRHAVTGSDYATVRAAAFMGARILGRTDYLATLDPRELARGALPDTMAGADFLARYGGTSDTVTAVRPGGRYPVRAATEHPVREHQRVLEFAALLPRLGTEPGAAPRLGALMRGSHESYRSCGLSSDGADRLVALCTQAGAAAGIFGARITGGGSGGTVAVLARAAAGPAIRDIAARYARETGRESLVFAGSGPGVTVAAARLA